MSVPDFRATRDGDFKAYKSQNDIHPLIRELLKKGYSRTKQGGSFPPP